VIGVATFLERTSTDEQRWPRQAEIAFLVLAIGQAISVKSGQSIAEQAARRSEMTESAAERRAQRSEEIAGQREVDRARLEDARLVLLRDTRDSATGAAVRRSLQINYEALAANREVLSLQITKADQETIYVLPLQPLDTSWWTLLLATQPREFVGNVQSFVQLQEVARLTNFYVRSVEAREQFKIAQGLGFILEGQSGAFYHRLTVYDRGILQITDALARAMEGHAALHGAGYGFVISRDTTLSN